MNLLALNLIGLLDSNPSPDPSSQVVLVVDSNWDCLALTAQVLQLWGYSVVTAADGLTALQLAETHQPVLVLTELMLPGLDGIGLIQRLRQQFDQVPIVVLTSVSGLSFRARAFLAGCNDYLEKPFQLEAVQATLMRWFQRSPTELTFAEPILEPVSEPLADISCS